MKKSTILSSIICITIICAFYILDAPAGVSMQGFRLLGIFIATILAIILKVMPIGALSILAICIVAISGVTIENHSGNISSQSIKNALSGFNIPLIWLIGLSIMISRGIIKTRLGERIGYFFIYLFGKRALGLAYSLVVSETMIAPVTPSNTARGGGVIHPIMKSIANNFKSTPQDNTQNRIGKFLSLVNFQTNPITSCMFLTATAPNPLVVDFIAKATNSNITLSWGTWALAMFLPCIVALLVMPLVVYKVLPPEIKDTKDAQNLAREQLAKMGKISLKEYLMLGIFIIMLSLWAGIGGLFGFKINAASVALLGLSLSLVTGILSWEDVLKEKSAWDTIVWFSALVMMANFLAKLGVIAYFAQNLETFITNFGMGWFSSCMILVLVFLYAHYFFASTTAHISAMFAAFYATGLALGAPPMLFGLMMAAAGNIMMTLTHYSTGTAPIIFGSGYSSIGEWWKMGFILSIVNIVIFMIVGGVWWKFLGYF